MSRTEYLRQYKAEEYIWLKSLGMCVRCRKEKAMKGHTMCLICMSDDAEKSRRYRERKPVESRESSSKRHKRLYSERKEAGMCVSCGNRPPKDGRVRCGICLARHRRNAEALRRRRGQWSHDELMEPGVCYNCHAPSLPEKKLCADCREKSMINLKKANLAIDHYNHPWRYFSFGSKGSEASGQESKGKDKHQ